MYAVIGADIILNAAIAWLDFDLFTRRGAVTSRRPRAYYIGPRADAAKTVRNTAGLDSLIAFAVEGAGHLVLLRQEDSSQRPVGLGDDPDDLPSYWVGAEDAPAVSQRPLVLPPVVGIQVPPIPGAVAGQVTERILPGLLQQLQSSRSGYYPTQGEGCHQLPTSPSESSFRALRPMHDPLQRGHFTPSLSSLHSSAFLKGLATHPVPWQCPHSSTLRSSVLQ